MNSEASELYSSLGEERLSLIFEAALSGMIMVDELGRVVLVNSQVERFVLASIVDITECKHSEDLLQEKLLELQRSNEDLQQFAYACSHDLQEPLRVISNYSQLLARRYSDKLDQDANDFIDFTVEAAMRMQELINDLLVYSMVDTNGNEFVSTDCSEIVSIALANLRLAIYESGAVVDSGQGFDMKYGERISVIFQRLRTKEMYPGSPYLGWLKVSGWELE